MTPATGDAVTCPLCRAGAQVSVLHLSGLPGLCNAFWPTEDSARSAPRGDIDLRFCPACGLLHNAGFVEGLASYSPEYENSIHFSAVFQDYIDELAARLVERYDLRGKEIVEVGCGSGDFLAAICRLGDNRGTGYDPSHDPARAADSGGRVTISADPYPLEGTTAQFVTSRHVLEHVPDPAALVAAVRASLGDRSDAVVYFEVPDATHMLEAAAIWDVIHEHCSYFTEQTLVWLFRRAGFEILASGRSLGDQYLWVEARPVPIPAEPPVPPDTSETAALVQRFRQDFESIVEGWRDRLHTIDPGRIAVWGAGAKGVMFLNLVDPASTIRRVVDINPHKQGRHLPVCGQRIEAPQSLADDPPAAVVVMNPLFTEEIRRALADHGVQADLLPA